MAVLTTVLFRAVSISEFNSEAICFEDMRAEGNVGTRPLGFTDAGFADDCYVFSDLASASSDFKS